MIKVIRVANRVRGWRWNPASSAIPYGGPCRGRGHSLLGLRGSSNPLSLSFFPRCAQWRHSTATINGHSLSLFFFFPLSLFIHSFPSSSSSYDHFSSELLSLLTFSLCENKSQKNKNKKKNRYRQQSIASDRISTRLTAWRHRFLCTESRNVQ